MALIAQNWPDIEAAELGQVRIEAVVDLGILSVAIPKNGEAAANKVFKKAFGLSLPAIGNSLSKKGNTALGLQADLFFLTFPYQDAWQPSRHENSIGAAAYSTDQSDAWVIFRVSGGDVKQALARVCKIDLHDDAFGIGSVTRTSMEHMGAILFREAQDSYLVFAATSSRHDFAHALVQSAQNITFQ